MGKIRAKHRNKSRRRPQPTGIPSVKEEEELQDLEPAPQPDIPVLEKLSALLPSERVWACHSLLHLMRDEENQMRLVRAGVVARVAPLLVDQQLDVREASASLLRDLSARDDTSLSKQIAHVDVLSFLSIMLRDCLALIHSEFVTETGSKADAQIHSEFVTETGSKADTADCLPCGVEEGIQNGMQGMECNRGEISKIKYKKKRLKRNGKRKEPEVLAGGALDVEGLEKVPTQQGVLDVLIHGLHMLGNICERSPAPVAKLCHHNNGILLLVLQLLAISDHSAEVAVAAAQLLLTLVEDNLFITQYLGSCTEHVTQLNSMLVKPSGWNGLLWQLTAIIAGVQYHLLPYITEDGTRSMILEAIFSSYGTLLDMELSEVQDAVDLLQARTVCMEVITNMAYTEGDIEEKTGVIMENALENGVDMTGDDEEEACLEDMEVESGLVETELVPATAVSVGSILKDIVNVNIHNKVLKAVRELLTEATTVLDGSNDACLAQSYKGSLLTSSLCAFQNLVCSLPLESWEGGTAKLVSTWSFLLVSFERVCADSLSALSGVLVAMVHKLVQGGVKFATKDEVQLIGRLGLSSEVTAVRSDMVTILGRVGRSQLWHADGGDLQILTMIGSVLKESVAIDSSLSVVCPALDSIFDIFGDDSCPAELFKSLALLPVLLECRASFIARYKVERKLLEPQLGLVQMVQSNLPRFISYMRRRM